MSDKIKIYLIEDNASHAELISRSFEAETLNYEITLYGNILHAKQAINTATPDIVVTDLNLPDGKGLELIPSSENTAQYPLILMTSFGDENIAVEAMKLGAFDYIVKSSEAFDAMPRSVERVLREWENIFEKEKAVSALLQKEHEQREIINSMIDGVISIDESGLILSFNKAAENMFGYLDTEVLGNNITMLMPEEYRAKHSEGLNRFLETGKAHIVGILGGVELKAQHKKSNIFPIRLSVAKLPDDLNGKRRFISSCHDLSKLKQQEEQLRRSQKMDAIGKLTGGIAHDYNNILGIVLGYTDLLIDKLSDQKIISEYLHEIQRASERGATLTNKLLSFSKQRNTDTATLNINSFLLEQKNLLEKVLTVRIKLILNLTDNIWPISVNKSDFEDAILNIVINAMHAISGSGLLTIQSSNIYLNDNDALPLQITPGDFVLVEFIDNGCGMNDETVEKIFDPFYSTKGEKGTGLGLSQVYGFVERSKGVINVNSEINKGTKISLYFPRHHSNDSINEETISEPEISLRGSESILLVDDEPALTKLSYEILTDYGYTVFTASNGIEALNLLDLESIDLIFSDVIMPHMDGYELAKIVQDKYPAIKIQLTSGFTGDKYQTNEIPTLQSNLLNKPVNSKTLLSRIRELLSE